MTKRTKLENKQKNMKMEERGKINLPNGKQDKNAKWRKEKKERTRKKLKIERKIRNNKISEHE